MPIAGAMQCPAVLSNTFLAHRRGSDSCAQPRCQWPRRRAKNALRYADFQIMPRQCTSEKRSRLRQTIQPCKIEEPTIHDGEASELRHDQVEHIYLVHFSVGNVDK